ncbi:MAG TPA: glycosyltransferase family 2 protein, partial [Dehalococcoidia bacterium]|nr:glycosyltransferase family 2 protein [Dehalococcoidia bacterium]
MYKGTTPQKTESVDHENERPTVIAAIPCFNEERFIGSIVLKTKKYVDRVIVIDDGSTDDTAQVASDAGATVYRHSRNLGYGAAIRTAYREARNLGVDVMLTLDGDGQHEPADIPQLLSPILNGEADVVVGSRFLGQAEKPPFYRRLGQRVLTIATNL